MKWMSENFDYSHDTSRNYRAAFDLSRNPNCSDFSRWNISVAGFYLIATTMNKGEVGAAKAVIKAARKGRVSTNAASQIIYAYHQRRQSDADSPPAAAPAYRYDVVPAAPAAYSYDVVVDDAVDDSGGDTDEQQWQSNLSVGAEIAIETTEALIRDYLDLGFKAPPPELIALVTRAANGWRELETRVDGSRSVSSSVQAKADAAEARSKSKHLGNGNAD